MIEKSKSKFQDIDSKVIRIVTIDKLTVNARSLYDTKKIKVSFNI